VFQRKGWDALYKIMDRHEMAVIGTGPSTGHVPDSHRLSAATANAALGSVDLVVFVGQYSMPSPGEWALPPGVPTIRVHPEQEDIGRNWPVDLGMVSDEKLFLEELADVLPKKKRAAWVDELASARKTFQGFNDLLYKTGLEHSSKTGTLHPAVLAAEYEKFFFKGDIDPKQTVTVGGGFTIARFAARNFTTERPGQGIVCGYQYGAMGPEIAMAFGAGVAVQRGVGPQAPYKGAPIVCVTGDGGAAYSLFEMDTANKYKVPMIVIIYNNDCWGTYGAAARTPQALHMYLFQEGLRYDKIAEGLGVRGEYVKSPKHFREALARSYQLAVKEGQSTVLNCQGIKEFGNGRVYPPGPAWPVEPGRGAIMH
jgi:thiamine pyrophosphate-dependent acetolactate synthase large subunit-like protein